MMIDLPQELQLPREGEVPQLEPIRAVPDPYNWSFKRTRYMKDFDDMPASMRERERRMLSNGDPI